MALSENFGPSGNFGQAEIFGRFHESAYYLYLYKYLWCRANQNKSSGKKQTSYRAHILQALNQTLQI